MADLSTSSGVSGSLFSKQSLLCAGLPLELYHINGKLR